MKAVVLEGSPKIVVRELPGTLAAYSARLWGCKFANCLASGFLILLFTCAVASAQIHPTRALGKPWRYEFSRRCRRSGLAGADNSRWVSQRQNRRFDRSNDLRKATF